MARWLNWLERPVHTREVESSSLSLATTKTSEISEVFSYKKMKRWLNRLERPVHTREVESYPARSAGCRPARDSSLSLATYARVSVYCSETLFLGIESLILDFMPNENFCVGKDMVFFLSFAQFLLLKEGDYLRFEEITAKSFS